MSVVSCQLKFWPFVSCQLTPSRPSYINHLNIAFKGEKDEKVRVVKAHIGSKSLTSIVQDTQNDIQPASDSNSESESDSDMVGRIVGSGGNSSELNDSGDQTADSQQEQEAEETILESSTSRYGRKRTRVLRENYVPWHNIHGELQSGTYNKTPN